MLIRLYQIRVGIMVPVTGLDLHFRPWRKLWSGSVQPSPAALIRAALNGFSSGSLHKAKERGESLSLLLGAGDRTRTGTPSLAADFESATSTISSHRRVPMYYITHGRKKQGKFELYTFK